MINFEDKKVNIIYEVIDLSEKIGFEKDRHLNIIL